MHPEEGCQVGNFDSRKPRKYMHHDEPVPAKLIVGSVGQVPDASGFVARPDNLRGG